MRVRRVLVAALAVLFATTSCVSIAAAHEDSVPMIITEPEDTDEPIPCAVFFADNMVYAPQWRIGNLVRIEAMVINMTDLDSPEDIMDSDLNVSAESLAALPIPPEVVLAGTEQQWALNNYPELLNETRMVSVNYIEVTITGPDGYSEAFVAEWEWDPETGEWVGESDGELGREVNKGGHLIYGMLWDTSVLDSINGIGDYTVEVRLGEWYNVTHAIAHLYNPEVEGDLLNDGYPFSSLLEENNPDYYLYGIGIGNVTSDNPPLEDRGYGWIVLGQLIPQGPGGGNGGDGGSHGEDGDGNNHCGDQSGGNSNGGSRYRSK